jgi:hypothetical protein
MDIFNDFDFDGLFAASEATELLKASNHNDAKDAADYCKRDETTDNCFDTKSCCFWASRVYFDIAVVGLTAVICCRGIGIAVVGVVVVDLFFSSAAIFIVGLGCEAVVVIVAILSKSAPVISISIP